MTREEINQFVADTIPEEAKIVNYEEVQTNNGISYRYTFRSTTRDLEFDVFSSVPGGSLTGYETSEYYDLGRDAYYKEKMRSMIEACPNSEMYNYPSDSYVQTYISLNFYMEDEEDAKAIAKIAAYGNQIVTEQWNYQPGEDLTKREVVGLYFGLYDDVGFKSRLGSYYLNGLDSEEEIYAKLKAML